MCNPDLFLKTWEAFFFYRAKKELEFPLTDWKAEFYKGTSGDKMFSEIVITQHNVQRETWFQSLALKLPIL